MFPQILNYSHIHDKRRQIDIQGWGSIFGKNGCSILGHFTACWGAGGDTGDLHDSQVTHEACVPVDTHTLKTDTLYLDKNFGIADMIKLEDDWVILVGGFLVYKFLWIPFSDQ